MADKTTRAENVKCRVDYLLGVDCDRQLNGPKKRIIEVLCEELDEMQAAMIDDKAEPE